MNNYLIIDPIDICKKFNALNIKFGFTLDHPMLTATEKEFRENLAKSFESAELMFERRN